MEEFALVCNYEHPVHPLIFDTNDKCWKNYSIDNEIKEIFTYKMKRLGDLPEVMNKYIHYLKDLRHVNDLKKKLSEETESPACEWIRYTILDYLHLFKCGYLPLVNQTERDMLRRV
ncbi:hypothetical protein K501DRAFT_309786 [Backusella circina FSU 941]|nr:hypothetical protein K501DRAFT_309786 [Backusella circina FSU 941]